MGFRSSRSGSGLARAPNLWWFFFGRLAEVVKKRSRERTGAHWTSTGFLNAALKVRAHCTGVLANSGSRFHASGAASPDGGVPVLLLPMRVPAWRHRERRWETGQKSIGLFQAMMPETPSICSGFRRWLFLTG
jgi:hypothetical protein